MVPNWRAFIADHEPRIICQFSCMYCQDKYTSLNFSILLILVKKIVFLNLQKRSIYTKNHCRRASRQFFLDSSRDFWSKTPCYHEKKKYFWFFPIKSSFSPFSPLQPSDKPYLDQMRYSKWKDNVYSCRVYVLDDIKVQKKPRTGILAWILGHNLTSNGYFSTNPTDQPKPTNS